MNGVLEGWMGRRVEGIGLGVELVWVDLETMNWLACFAKERGEEGESRRVLRSKFVFPFLPSSHSLAN